ncbi:MAG: phosphatase PAP2 family protein [Pseudomonadota bacterium]|nr:phosphatase PAP2 family protein [Pseudomonadota bacterium]
MPFLTRLVHLGDISLTLAAAAAIASALLAARAWRMAFWWSLLFGAGVGLVGASKIAFMAWGLVPPGLDFKAISGHATGVTAVLPTLLYLLLRRRGARARRAGVLAGLLLGALMGVLLVAQDEHSVAEALAGWALGAAISLASIRMDDAAAPVPAPARGAGQLALPALVFVALACLMRSFPFGYLMMRTAVFISGNASLFPWDTGG